MLLFGILILLISLAIASVAAYFSVIGLSLLFVGSGTAIIIMGGALEVGKLVTATVLHQMWNKMNWLLKTYLFIATFILMVITSLGIYGFLSNGYNTTSIKVKGFENNIVSIEKKIEMLKTENLKLENFTPATLSIDNISSDNQKFADQQIQLIEQKERRIMEIRQSIESERVSASQQIANAKAVLDEQVIRETNQITLYNNRLQILDLEVQTWLNQGTGGLFRQNGLEKARQVKDSQQKERDEIDLKIKSVENNIVSLRGDYNRTVLEVNESLRNQISLSEQVIQKIQNEVQESKNLITSSQLKTQTTFDTEKIKNEEIVGQNIILIKNNLQEIEGFNNQIKELENKIVATDVGTFKFVAKSLGTDLDTTVNWFILSIIFVFDPLAVALLLCFNYIIGLKKNAKLNPTQLRVESFEPSTPYPTPTHINTLSSFPWTTTTTTSTTANEDDWYPYKVQENGKLAFRHYPIDN